MVANYMAEAGTSPSRHRRGGGRSCGWPRSSPPGPELFRAMRQAGIDKAELAHRVGIASKDVDRLFSIHHKTRLEQVEAALAVVGPRLVVTVEPA